MKDKYSALKYAGIAVIVIVLLFPVYWMINCSLQHTNVIMTVPPTFFPTNPTLENFAKIFSNASYLRYFKNSFIVAFGTIAVVLIVSIPASFALSRYNFPGKHAIMSAISSVQMFPTVVILITLYGFYNKWGLLDTYRGLILADTTFALPLAITLLKSFYDTISKSIDEAARIDGANRLQILLLIDAQNVVQPECARDALLPPGVTVRAHGVPVEQRIAPKLPVRAERVRRDARGGGGRPVFFQQKRGAALPYVHAVVRDVQRHISEQFDARFLCVQLQ